jgi:orotate phosphoribosyltransferase
MNEIRNNVAKYLLQIKAIKLQPTNPFQWASGWDSPIYCDNRKTLSYPEIRTYIKEQFAKVIKEQYGDVDVIAGVATGAIALGALVADELGLPFVYIRSAAKKHGLENLIEGDIKPGAKVVVVEDLISTGGSSLKAVEALRSADCDVLGMTAIFTYGFDIAANNFKEANCKLVTLSDYEAMINIAVDENYINESYIDTLKEWRQDPTVWNK